MTVLSTAPLIFQNITGLYFALNAGNELLRDTSRRWTKKKRTDACPVKHIIVRLAKQRNIPVTMLIDTSHELNDGYSTIITVDKQADSVDYALMGLLTRDDIVVTQDFGLAAMVFGKGAKAVNQNGMIFSNDNIDKLLLERCIGQKVRRSGGRTKDPSKRTRENDTRFVAALEKLLLGE